MLNTAWNTVMFNARTTYQFTGSHRAHRTAEGCMGNATGDVPDDIDGAAVVEYRLLPPTELSNISAEPEESMTSRLRG
jgi:hypothetical protein